MGFGPASLSKTSSNTSLLPRVTCDDAACRKYVGKNIFRRLPGERRDPLGGFCNRVASRRPPFRCAEAKNRFFQPVQLQFRNAGVTFRACRHIQHHLSSDPTRLSGSDGFTMAESCFSLNAVSVWMPCPMQASAQHPSIPTLTPWTCRRWERSSGDGSSIVATVVAGTPGTPGLLVVRTSLAGDGRVVEYDHEYWRHDAIRVHVDLKVQT